jgi:hypothetical protein
MAAAKVRATVAFVATLKNGVERVVAYGQVLAGSDPVVKARPGLFEPYNHE